MHRIIGSKGNKKSKCVNIKKEYKPRGRHDRPHATVDCMARLAVQHDRPIGTVGHPLKNHKSTIPIDRLHSPPWPCCDV
uniref:Uncharacterized protein n=1 Tax=Romanomermis culicivorax TaxID=13658 RepID=A0A915IWV9_ROMCU